MPGLAFLRRRPRGKLRGLVPRGGTARHQHGADLRQHQSGEQQRATQPAGFVQTLMQKHAPQTKRRTAISAISITAASVAPVWRWQRPEQERDPAGDDTAIEQFRQQA